MKATKAESLGHFRSDAITIPVDPLLRMQGYRDPSRIRADVREIATRAAALAETVVTPEAHYRRVAVSDCADGALVLEAGVIFHSEQFATVLRDCREVIAFVLTLGTAIDEETRKLAEKDAIVDALFLETAGWYAVEQAARNFARYLWTLSQKDGYRLSRRLGPGYYDWPLEEQADLFRLFEGAPLPVRLLESCAMLPKKSRSGLYGLLPSSYTNPR